ncbi:hypothetical protein LAWI1_G006277 [Lachnellula willkommii]|uniref:Uncharacterized protein n=1 Tax=Lachnellula willkommii TaxID=215461 RepID=A0A559M6I8_9HELO|nr:hypothetical protein LAWI1_G006277 [Lachnellula willkommii]
MLASRTASRAAARAIRAPIRTTARQARHASTNEQAAAAGGSSGLVGGLAGGALVFAAGYSYYHFSGAKSIVNAASATKSKFKSLTNSVSESAPEPNEALKWLRSTATSYAAFIPGGKSYVDTAFKDLDAVQEKHGPEVEKIVAKAYGDLKEVSKNGLSMETVTKSWEVLEKAVTDLGALAGDAAEQILDNHPQIKEKVGGNIKQLKEMADSYGPEAKKEMEEMWGQIGDVIKGGVSVGSVEKIRKMVQEKVEKVKKLGDEAWKKGLEQAQPYLEKNPEVKKIVEENADALKQGNVSQVFEKVKDAVSSGNTDELKKYVQQAGDKAKKSGFGQSMEQYAKMIPGGGEIIPKLQKLQEVAQKHGDEAEKILKGAYKDIQDILQKRTSEVEKLADKAGKEAKK